ncbi:MAG: hypothetical protein K9H84_03585 [Bacteroidales bacterium]|nr:hypothetical protein [Bacteroidales bacterium]
MKKQVLILTATLIMVFFQLSAQDKDPEEPQYLFESGNIQISGFGGPGMSFSMIGDDFAVYSGGGGAVLINQKLFIGGYGEGLATKHTLDESVVSCPDKNALAFGYGGIWIGYIYQPLKLIHLNINTLIGWGGISLYDDEFDVHNLEHCDRDGVFVLLPQIEMEVNLTSWMKFTAGAGYRFTTGISNSIYDTDIFNQPNIRLGVMFGNFNPDK